jgi:hypothetical protein
MGLLLRLAVAAPRRLVLGLWRPLGLGRLLVALGRVSRLAAIWRGTGWGAVRRLAVAWWRTRGCAVLRLTLALGRLSVAATTAAVLADRGLGMTAARTIVSLIFGVVRGIDGTKH